MDLLLQLCFVAGAFLQTFLMLRKKGVLKRTLWLFVIWLAAVAWLYFITRTGSTPTQQPRILIFGVIFWSIMAGISFVKQWATKVDAGLLFLNALTLAYAFAIQNTLLHFLTIALALSLIIFLITRFIKEEKFASRLLRYLLYFGMTIAIAIMVFRFGELYLLIDPSKPITLPWHTLFTGGMFFFYIGIHGAILFYLWSLSWGALFSKQDPFQQAKYQYPTSPSVEGVLSDIDTQSNQTKTFWIVPTLAALFYLINLSFNLLPHTTVLPATFVILPEVAVLLKKSESRKK